MGAGMWDNEEFTRPLGVPVEAERNQGTGAGVSSENGSVDGNNHSPGTETTGPAPLSAQVSGATICQNCTHAFREHRPDGLMPHCTFAPPIWPPDEWDMLARIEKAEAKIIELETMLGMAVEVASKAAQIADKAADQAVRAAKASLSAADHAMMALGRTA